MLFYENLENIIFTRNQLFLCDELVILSGYIGPTPIKKLQTLPIKSTVIYGMYAIEGIQKRLHETILAEQENLTKVTIRYSKIPVHSKCYIWKYQNNVVHALIGSANFSVNGLTTPYKEILAETTVDTFIPLNEYVNTIIEQTIDCKYAVAKENRRRVLTAEQQIISENNLTICSMPLYIIKNRQKIVPEASGINWGMAGVHGTSHVNPNDAYIKISADMLKNYPELFPKKQLAPTIESNIVRMDHRHNDNIEILWDDGTTMTGLLEGSIPKIINGTRELFPKQISTTPRKSELGKYLRKRLGVAEGVMITMADLERYGRTTIDVSLQGEGVYYFDFSI